MNVTSSTMPDEASIEVPFVRFPALVLMAQDILPLGGGSNGARPPARWVEILVRPQLNGESQSPGDLLGRVARAWQAREFDIHILRDVLKFLETDSDIDRCSINVFGQSLSDRGFLNDVLALIEVFDVDPRRLCFEITETSPISDFSAAKTFAKVLRGRGCKMALDDFGAGVSNLPLLAPNRMDYLKIDGRFVRQMDRGSDSLALVRGLVAMAREVGLQVIAECVETAEQHVCAQGLGIDFYQGFFRQGEPKPLLHVPAENVPILGGSGDDSFRQGVLCYE